MTVEERQIGRIKAVLYASEEVISRAKPKGLMDVVNTAKDTAYDHILGIIEDPGYCPWAE